MTSSTCVQSASFTGAPTILKKKLKKYRCWYMQSGVGWGERTLFGLRSNIFCCCYISVPPVLSNLAVSSIAGWTESSEGPWVSNHIIIALHFHHGWKVKRPWFWYAYGDVLRLIFKDDEHWLGEGGGGAMWSTLSRAGLKRNRSWVLSLNKIMTLERTLAFDWNPTSRRG